MTVPTSYPGVYIQELPSLVHTITPAPTSVAVFVGYTHPFRTLQFGTAVQLFSFADYQVGFGGFFSSPWQPDHVGQAVYQFFLNGGQTCYVVGLQAKQYYTYAGSPPELTAHGLIVPASVTAGGITFTALQPVGSAGAGGLPMQVALSNIKETSSPDDTADIVISYGTTVETYRKVRIGGLQTTLAASNLVTVTPSSPPATAFPTTGSPFSLGYSSGDEPPADGGTVINPLDFAPVFADYASLDKVPVFNLLVTPGITDPGVTSEAVAYCERKRAFYIMDTPSPQTAGWDVNTVVGDLGRATPLSPEPPVSINAAVYYPWLMTTDPVTGARATSPPSGFVAGIYGQVDTSQGVWQSPAGIQTTLLGTTGPLGTAALPGRAAPEGTGAPPGTAAPEGKPAAAGEVAVLGPATPGLPEADPSVLRPAGAAPSVPGAAWAAPAGLTDAGNAGPAWGRTTGAGGPDAGSSRPTAPSAASLPAAGLTPLPPHPAAPGSGPGRGEVTGRDLTARPPAPGWLWGTPVELPERGSVADGAGRPPSGTLPPGDGQELIGTQAGGERAGLVRDLLPPSAGAGRSGEQAGTGRSARQAPARVTIGTIEVTVVPPARPAHGAAGPALVPPLPAAPQPASQLAEAGAVWLRDGLRRWYGIAQG